MSGSMNWTMKGRNGKRSVLEKPHENWTKDERIKNTDGTISILSIVYTIERKHATVTLNLRLLPDAKSYPVQHHFSSILRRFTP